MRKLIWCCLAAGLLTTGSFLSLAYYAYRCPDSAVGRSMQVLAESSLAMQPFSGLTSLAVRTSRANAQDHETTAASDESIPDDPQPIAPEPKEEVIGSRIEADLDAAPIVIGEEDPMPREEAEPIVPAPMERVGIRGQEIPANGSPLVMPPCRDDELPMLPPRMPYTDEDDDKPASADAKKSDTKTEHTVFKAWIDLFEEGKEEKSPAVEELPAPTEMAPQAEPKCQEDTHLHEHYSGCPPTTCPYSGKKHVEQNHNRAWDYFKGYRQRPWDLHPNFMKMKGGEENSEEPRPPSTKPKQSKDGKDKNACPRTQGVDTMEYRKSDAGLDEYGPGPLH